MLELIAVELQQADAFNFWIWTAILAGVTLLGFWGWFWALKCARIIEDTPTSRCRSAAQGYAELAGVQKHMPGEPIKGPLTGKDCTWWEFTVEEKQETYSNGRRRTHWETIAEETSESLFLIEDETGEAVVDPDGADVTESATDVWYGSTSRPVQPPGTGSVLTGRYRYTERRMHPGERLYAIGLFETRSGHHEPVDKMREVSALLSEWKRDKEALVARFDTDGDGEIDMQEWEKARAAAIDIVEEQARKAAAEAAAIPAVNIMRLPGDGRPYLLSTKPQDELSRHYRRYSVLGLATFFVCGAASVFMIGARLAA